MFKKIFNNAFIIVASSSPAASIAQCVHCKIEDNLFINRIEECDELIYGN